MKDVLCLRFRDQIVLITGAAGGIGRATAKAFAEEGAKLALVDLKQGPLDETVSQLRLEEGRYETIAADVSKATMCGKRWTLSAKSMFFSIMRAWKERSLRLSNKRMPISRPYWTSTSKGCFSG